MQILTFLVNVDKRRPKYAQLTSTKKINHNLRFKKLLIELTISLVFDSLVISAGRGTRPVENKKNI